MVLDVNQNGIPDFLEQRTSASTSTTFNPPFEPIFLPDDDAKKKGQTSWSVQQALDWFQFVAPKGAKGTAKNLYYTDLIALMDRLGIPKDKRADAWKDAIAWTQTPGSGAVGDPKDYFLGFVDVSRYADAGTSQFGTTKTKGKTVTTYSTSDAASQILGTYRSELGFEPGAEDVATYQAAVNKAAKAEPATYSTTTTVKPGPKGVKSVTDTQSKTQTGFDPTMFALEYARSNPEYAENFAVKNFLTLIDNSLKDPNRIGLVVE